MDIFIFNEKAVLKRNSHQIAVYENDKKIIAYPLTAFESIYLFGNIEIRPSATSFLLKNNKYVIFLNSSGFFKGILFGKENGNNLKRRKKQFTFYFDNNLSLDFQKFIILEKIKSIENTFGISLEKEKNSLSKAKNSQNILGIEGFASAKMFDKFRSLLLDINIEFKKREYYPPKDKVNSLLSSIYTLYYNLLIPALLKEGYDVYLGILHNKKGSHHAFVSDVLEFLRPELTFFVYEYLKEKNINKIQFFEKKGGIYLEKDSLKEFLIWLSKKDYLKLINTYKNKINNYFDQFQEIS